MHSALYILTNHEVFQFSFNIRWPIMLYADILEYKTCCRPEVYFHRHNCSVSINTRKQLLKECLYYNNLSGTLPIPNAFVSIFNGHKGVNYDKCWSEKVNKATFRNIHVQNVDNSSFRWCSYDISFTLHFVCNHKKVVFQNWLDLPGPGGQKENTANNSPQCNPYYHTR